MPIPPTIAVLRELLDFDAETGRLFWRERGGHWFASPAICAAWNQQYSGRVAFATPCAGYRVGRIAGQRFGAHRIVFAMFHGRWPDHEVDHINGDASDNRPGNLREATHVQNCRNSPSKGKTSRFKGVAWDGAQRKWRAVCNDDNGRLRRLGRFRDETEAAVAHDNAARKWHGEFARLNFPEGSTR
jgi:hypothetical protein